MLAVNHALVGSLFPPGVTIVLFLCPRGVVYACGRLLICRGWVPLLLGAAPPNPRMGGGATSPTPPPFYLLGGTFPPNPPAMLQGEGPLTPCYWGTSPQTPREGEHSNSFATLIITANTSAGFTTLDVTGSGAEPQ